LIRTSGRGRSVQGIGEHAAPGSVPGHCSVKVACFNDGCFLLDACWKCGALVAPLSQTVPATEFLYVKCTAPLAKAPSLHWPGTVRDQEAIYAFLARLAEYPTDAAAYHYVIMASGSVLLIMPAVPTISEPCAAKLRRDAHRRSHEPTRQPGRALTWIGVKYPS
jgi:hypothetical protein